MAEASWEEFKSKSEVVIEGVDPSGLPVLFQLSNDEFLSINLYVEYGIDNLDLIARSFKLSRKIQNQAISCSYSSDGSSFLYNGNVEIIDLSDVKFLLPKRMLVSERLKDGRIKYRIQYFLWDVTEAQCRLFLQKFINGELRLPQHLLL